MRNEKFESCKSIQLQLCFRADDGLFLHDGLKSRWKLMRIRSRMNDSDW